MSRFSPNALQSESKLGKHKTTGARGLLGPSCLTLPCLTLVLALTAALLLSAPGLSQPEVSWNNPETSGSLEVLGAEATVYRLHLIDQNGQNLAPSSISGSSLELEVSRLAEQSVRLVVPGTEDLQSENAPSLSFSQSTQTLLIAWEDQVNALHSKIRVVGYRESEGFFDLLDLVGNHYYSKQRPQVLLTSDTTRWKDTTVDEHGVETVVEREVNQRVLHLIWRESQGHIFYTALAEGSSGAMATTQTLDLSELLPELPEAIEAGIDGSLSLVQGRSGRSVMILFTDPLRRTLETVEISSLPIELSMLADTGFDSVLDSEADPDSGLVAASEAARSRIVFIGRRLASATTTRVLSEAAAESILEAEQPTSADGWVAVAEHARSRIVFIGRSLATEGRLNRDAAVFVLPLSLTASTASTDDSMREPTVNLIIRHLSSRPLPEEAPSDANLIVSPDGERVLLFWQGEDGNELHFTESNGQEWTNTYRLGAQQTGGLPKAEALLRNRFSTGR